MELFFYFDSTQRFVQTSFSLLLEGVAMIDYAMRKPMGWLMAFVVGIRMWGR